jgi:hypothetical protein
MPNYKTSNDHLRQFKRQANELIDSTLALRLLDFPLTAQEAFDCVWSRELQGAWLMVREAQVYMHHDNHLDVDVVTPEATVRLKIVARDLKYPYFNGGNRPLNLAALPADRQAAFEAWLDPAFEYARQMRVARRIVEEFFDRWSGGTLASIVKRWPGMSVVMQEIGDPWAERLRKLPRDIHAFGWPSSGKAYDWFVDNEEKMEVISALFTGAQMHGIVVDKSPVQCTVEDWKLTPESISAIV